MNPDQSIALRRLAEAIRAIEQRSDAPERHFIDQSPAAVPTAWPDIDALLGGGLSPGLHEWFLIDPDFPECPDRSSSRSPSHRWAAPLCILAHLAWQAIADAPNPRWTLWIGTSSHPYPRILIRGDDRRLLDRSLFIAAPDAPSRLWAIDLALRSSAVGCVLADAAAFDRAATQRIQMLARNRSKLLFTACPPSQQNTLSAAHTRWRAAPAPPDNRIPTDAVQPRWIVQLLRCKGMRPAKDHPAWLLEWNRDQGALRLSPRLADLARTTESSATPTRPPRRRIRSA